MPRYAVLGDHAPTSCPGSSKGAESLVGSLMDKLGDAAAKFGVNLEGPPLHLDPSHKTLMIAEAPTAEAMRDFVYEIGLNQFNNLAFYMVTPIPEMVAMSASWPKVYP